MQPSPSGYSYHFKPYAKNFHFIFITFYDTDLPSTSFTDEVSTENASYIAVSVNHPTVSSFNGIGVRVFLRLYDKYATLVLERAQQQGAQGTIATKPYHSVCLIYLFSSELLESATELGFIPEVISYYSLTDDYLRDFLKEKGLENKFSMTI